MVDYNKNMEIKYYTETEDIEIVQNDENGLFKNAILYFRRFSDFYELLKTSPRLCEKLKQFLNNGGI